MTRGTSYLCSAKLYERIAWRLLHRAGQSVGSHVVPVELGSIQESIAAFDLDVRLIQPPAPVGLL